MDKYKILKEKLNDIIKHINNMTIEDEETREYLKKYETNIREIANSTVHRTIRNSHGAVFGLLMGVSDYEEICKDIQLLKMLADADKYYSEDCYTFD